MSLLDLAGGTNERTNAKISSGNIEEHLRRELEEGNITWHDFEHTKRFAASGRSFYKATLATGALTSAWCVYYGRWYRKRPWSRTATFYIAPIGFVVGMIPGICLQAFRVRKFQAGLEDPKGLVRAMRRIIGHQADVYGDPKVRETTDPQDPVNISLGNQPDRWAELRNASTPASNSTWDKIRQSHEQTGTTRVSTNPGLKSQNGSDGRGVTDRQTEQAAFDALLEAERKM